MEWLSVFTPEAAQRLAENHKEQLPLKGTSRERDFEPVCKLFLPWTSGTWLLTVKRRANGTPYRRRRGTPFSRLGGRLWGAPCAGCGGGRA